MRYVLVIYEGAVDAPCDELEGATPLQIARNVNASALARRGKSACLLWQQTGEPVSRPEHALALLLGIKPSEAKILRRGPVEAAAVAGPEPDWTYAYQGNLVAIDEGVIRENRVAGLTMDETVVLTSALKEKFAGHPLKIYPLAPARLAVLFEQMQGKVDPGIFPESGSDSGLRADEDAHNDRERFMLEAGKLLSVHSINEVRVDLGENPASGIWLWGGGAPVSVSRPFPAEFKRTAMVTNSPLARGMATMCGMTVHDLGEIWTELAQPEVISKERLVDCLERNHLTVIYVEASMDGGCFGDPVEKVKAMDRLDVFVLARIMESAAAVPDTRIMLTTIPEEGVEFDFSPVIMSGAQVQPDSIDRWQEESCDQGALGSIEADRCLATLVGE